MNRRDAIKALGTALGAASASKLLAGCGDNGPHGPVGITNFVFMMMENRSYDHYLGARTLIEGLPGDGLVAGMSNNDLDGNPVEIFPGDPAMLCVPDPPHGWDASRTQFNSGANDGFVIAHQQSNGPGLVDCMGYLQRAQAPVSWALADAYTTCDRWFCSVLGPTLPNRMFWHAATSNKATSNDEVLKGRAFDGVTSIYHRLNDAEVEWKYYYGDVPVLAFVDDLDKEGKLRPFQDFIEDAREGILPPVSYIDPAFSYNDDHPPHHPLLGQQLIAAVYQALATSVHWNNTMLVITYDENGGFFDHVPPPTTADDNADLGFDQLGFRVPAMVIGPYAKESYISSVQYDHTSALKHIENEFGLEPLGARDAAAVDLIDCIDLERLAAGDPRPPIEIPAVDITIDDVPEECIGGGLERRYPDHAILEWARDHRDELGPLDLTDQAEGMIYEIAAYLESQGLGSIK